jgi:hypothetical protein
VGTYFVSMGVIRRKQGAIAIPIEILQNRDFSAMEAVVCYLKEEHGLTYSEIASVLNRDDRTVWTTYHRAQKKVTRL